jgi:protein TonB
VKPLPEAEKGGKPSRLRLGGEVQASKLVNKVMPVYPASAKTAGVQGTVILRAVIGMDGRPLSLRVMNNDIDPELARAAIGAVSQWRYRPTLLNGEPIEIDTTIMVNFSLES